MTIRLKSGHCRCHPRKGIAISRPICVKCVRVCFTCDDMRPHLFDSHIRWMRPTVKLYYNYILGELIAFRHLLFWFWVPNKHTHTQTRWLIVQTHLFVRWFDCALIEVKALRVARLNINWVWSGLCCRLDGIVCMHCSPIPNGKHHQ